MKNLIYQLGLMMCVLFLASCSKDDLEENITLELITEVDPRVYSSIETEVLELVNDYRLKNGLAELDYMDEISWQAESHNQHMIESDEVCHHNFPNRYSALVASVEAGAVSENVAYGYRSAKGVVAAWIKSEGHQENLAGNFTHFGISVQEDAEGKLYYTNIFVSK